MNRQSLPAGAWWLWALSLAVAASQTFDVLLLVMISLVVYLVVVRHADESGMRTLRFYAFLAAVIVVMRVVFRLVIGGDAGGAVLFRLPEIPLPGWAAGIRLGGPVTADELRMGFVDGLRLGTLVFSVGGANALADPRRLMRSLPRALHSVGTAATVALGLAPQLVASAVRIRRASKARSGPSGRRGVVRLINPVISDALDRSLALAVSMEVRGFGRPVQPGPDRSFTLTSTGLMAAALGMYMILDGAAPTLTGVALLTGGATLTGIGLHLAGRRRAVTRYRPIPWTRPAWIVAGSGLAVAIVILLVGAIDRTGLVPSGLAAPPLAAVLGVLVGATPAVVLPPPGPTRLEGVQT